MEEKEKNDQLPVKASIDVFARFDQLDDELIIEELESRVIDTWVYHFSQEGHEIWGLAKVGIDECAKELGKKGVALRDEELTCDPDPSNPEYMLFKAKVSKVFVSKDGHEAKVESAIGTKRQWIMMRRKSDGKLMENRFWFEQGSMKALRNAKSRLIPEEIKAKVILNAKKLKKVKTIEPRKEETKNPATQKMATTKKSSEKKESPDFPAEDNGLFSDKEESPGADYKASQAVLLKIQRLEATLVDKFRFSPDTLMDKLEKKFGITDISGIDQKTAEEIIRFFERTIEHNESKQLMDQE